MPSFDELVSSGLGYTYRCLGLLKARHVSISGLGVLHRPPLYAYQILNPSLWWLVANG